MTKRESEGKFGAALRDVDIAKIVYKPPDDARTWKPCDFMVWLDSDWHGGLQTHRYAASVWFECKDLPPTVVDSFPFSELRPSQLQGIRDAARIGIPYWLGVYWRRHKAWTISNAIEVLAWKGDAPGVTSIPRKLLMSRFGVDASPAVLSSTLKSILLGDV